jgi:hypothetical protein
MWKMFPLNPTQKALASYQMHAAIIHDESLILKAQLYWERIK